jgi:hypothetical protein
MLTTLGPAAGEVLVPTTWRTRQAVAQRLLDTARRVGLDVRVVRRGRGGYIVPVSVARALGESTSVESSGPRVKQALVTVEPETPRTEQQRTQRDIILEAFTDDPALMALSAREVARRLGVDHSTVGKVRKAIQRHQQDQQGVEGA